MDKKFFIPLREIIGTNKEAVIKTAINNFYCQDKEVENFLKNKAFEFEKRHKSRTYLVFDDEKINQNTLIILGFYTLTMKTLELGKTLSKSTIKRIDGFSKDVLSTEAVLIGQLGKNEEFKDKINGQEILLDAIDVIYAVKNLVGGRIVFLECEEKQKLIDFYSRNGFEILQKSGEYLQMIKYL